MFRDFQAAAVLDDALPGARADVVEDRDEIGAMLSEMLAEVEADSLATLSRIHEYDPLEIAEIGPLGAGRHLVPSYEGLAVHDADGAYLLTIPRGQDPEIVRLLILAWDAGHTRGWQDGRAELAADVARSLEHAR